MTTPDHRARRAFTAIAAVLFLATLLAGCGSDSDSDKAAADTTTDGTAATVDAPDTITIGYQKVPNGDLIVKQEGWLEEAFGEGTKIEWKLFDSGGSVNEAVIAGAVDIGLAGSSPVSRGLSAPIEYQVPWIFDVIGEAEALAVRGDDIKTVADLKGKKIATPVASTSHYSLLAALDDAGLSANDVTIVDAEPDDILAAWTRGDIDAAYVWNPVLAKLVEGGGHKLVTSAELAKEGKTTYDLAIVTNKFAKAYPDAVKLWVEQQDRAVKLIEADPDAAAKDVANELEITPAEAKAQLADLIFVDAATQVGADYLGGGLAKNLFAAAKFNKDVGSIEAIQDEAAYTDGVNPTFAAAVADGS
jgi:taurine transport system substrate-binding protein